MANKVVIDTELNVEPIVASVSQIENKIKEVVAEIRTLKASMDSLAKGGGANDSRFKTMESDVTVLKSKLADLEQQLASVQKSSMAPSNTPLTLEQIKDAVNESIKGLVVLREESTKTNKKLDDLGKSAKNSGSGFNLGLKNIMKYAFGIRSVFAAMNKLRSAITESFTEYAKADIGTNTAIQSMKNSLDMLKASFAPAFAPIIEVVAPYISAFIDMIRSAVEALGELIAALSGKSTYTVAVRKQQQYAGALNKTAAAAKKARTELAGFDQLNVLHSDKNSGGSSGGASVGGGGSAFEYENREVSSQMKAIADVIKDILPLVEAVGLAFIGWEIGSSLITGLKGLGGVGTGSLGLIAKAVAVVGTGFAGWSIGNRIYELITGNKVNLSVWEQLKGIIESIAEGTAADAFIKTWEWAFDGVFGEGSSKEINKYFDGVYDSAKEMYDKMKKDSNYTVNAEKIAMKYLTDQAHKKSEEIQKDINKTKTTADLAIVGFDILFGDKSKSLKDTAHDVAKKIIDESNGTYSNLEMALIGIDKLVNGEKLEIETTASTLSSSIVNGVSLTQKSIADSLTGTAQDIFTFTSSANDMFGQLFNNIMQGFANAVKGFNDMTTAGINAGALISAQKKTTITPKVPHLASGAVIPPNRQFMAVLGDQKSGTNIEAPLSTIKQAVSEVVGNGGAGDIVVQIDGREVFRAVQNQAKTYKNRTGALAF